jgi:hypothetical protein
VQVPAFCWLGTLRKAHGRSIARYRPKAAGTSVWVSTDEYLAGLNASELDKAVTIKPVGEMSLLQALGGMCLTHGYRHLGEIEYARGPVGLKGATI